MINSKKKGSRGELELANILREYGYDVHRTQQYCGNTGQAADCVGLPDIHIECKRVETLNLYKAVEQATNDANAEGKGNMPVVFHKRNRKPWVAILSLDDFMKLYEGRKEK